MTAGSEVDDRAVEIPARMPNMQNGYMKMRQAVVSTGAEYEPFRASMIVPRHGPLIFLMDRHFWFVGASTF